MRERVDIENDFYDHTSYGGHITVAETRGKEKLMMEVLLDIRNLLSLESKTEVFSHEIGFAEPGDSIKIERRTHG